MEYETNGDTKRLEQKLKDREIGGQVNIIQTTELLRSLRLLRRAQETCCHSDSSRKPPINPGVKKKKNNNKNQKILK